MLSCRHTVKLCPMCLNYDISYKPIMTAMYYENKDSIQKDVCCFHLRTLGVCFNSLHGNGS